MLPEIRTRQCRFPIIDRGRDTAVPCPLYHSGAAGIDIRSNLVASELMLPEIRTRQCRIPTIDRGRDTALPCPLYH